MQGTPGAAQDQKFLGDPGHFIDRLIGMLWRDRGGGLAAGWGAGSVGSDFYHVDKNVLNRLKWLGAPTAEAFRETLGGYKYPTPGSLNHVIFQGLRNLGRDMHRADDEAAATFDTSLDSVVTR